MKILQLHNRYQIVGGEEGVVQAEQQLLRDHGHEVRLLEVSNDDLVGVKARAIAAVSAIYSYPSRAKVAAAIASFQPDLVHVHNFFPLLSPSVYDACAKAGIPLVQTLHNYRLACPKAMFFRDNEICEACLDQKSLLPSIKYGCYRGSKPQTAVVAAMLTWHRQQNTWNSQVNAYIALTDFQKVKLVQAGIERDRIHVKSNFVYPPARFSPMPDQTPYFLFVGRLAEEKGVATLIAAYRANGALWPLKIVGTGPLEGELRSQCADMGDRVQFLGRQEKPQVLQLMQNAKALVFPSIWYEGFPLTIAEAFACGLPVVVPSLGSMAEIVQDEVTGLQFRVRDGGHLAERLSWLMENEGARLAFADRAKQTFAARYTPQVNYGELMAIYDRARGLVMATAP
jgi:glycosyltransferase involved in cell wall biosynthesis